MTDTTLSPALQPIEHYQRTFGNATKRWRFWYRALLVISACFSTGAAVVGKVEFANAADVASIMAGLATLVTTAIASLNFEANWRSNRRSRRNVDALGLEARKSSAKPDELLTALQEILKQHGEDGAQDN